MRIRFETSIDKYNEKGCANIFPNLTNFVPRIGEMVSVKETFIPYYINLKLPSKLEVVNVVYYENDIVCYLWFRDIDIQIAKEQGYNLLKI